MSSKSSACAAVPLASAAFAALVRREVPMTPHAPLLSVPVTRCTMRAAGSPTPASVTPIVSRNARAAVARALDGGAADTTKLARLVMAVRSGCGFGVSDGRHEAMLDEHAIERRPRRRRRFGDLRDDHLRTLGPP